MGLFDTAMKLAGCQNGWPPAEQLRSVARRLAAQPRDSALWTALGALHLRNGAMQPAMKAFSHAGIAQGANPLARALMGEALLARGDLKHGPRLYRERWTLREGGEPMRYDPRLLWDGQCRPGTRLLLWTGPDADPGLALARLAPLLGEQRMQVALDLPEHVLALATSWWPQLHPEQAEGRFDVHYPLADVLTLWLNPSPDVLHGIVLPQPLKVNFGAANGTGVGIALDRTRCALSFEACARVLSDQGARPCPMLDTEAWSLGEEIEVHRQIQRLRHQLEQVDAVITSSRLVAHAAGICGRPFVYVSTADDGWCWGSGSGPSLWYRHAYVLRSAPGEDGGRLAKRIPSALQAVL